MIPISAFANHPPKAGAHGEFRVRGQTRDYIKAWILATGTGGQFSLRPSQCFGALCDLSFLPRRSQRSAAKVAKKSAGDAAIKPGRSASL